MGGNHGGVKENDALIDPKKRLTLRGATYDHYRVLEYADGRIVLEPRELIAPFELSNPRTALGPRLECGLLKLDSVDSERLMRFLEGLGEQDPSLPGRRHVAVGFGEFLDGFLREAIVAYLRAREPFEEFIQAVYIDRAGLLGTFTHVIMEDHTISVMARDFRCQAIRQAEIQYIQCPPHIPRPALPNPARAIVY